MNTNKNGEVFKGKKLIHYMLYFPSDMYPMDIYGYTKKNAIDEFKKQFRIKRMQNGYWVTEYSENGHYGSVDMGVAGKDGW